MPLSLPLSLSLARSLSFALSLCLSLSLSPYLWVGSIKNEPPSPGPDRVMGLEVYLDEAVTHESLTVWGIEGVNDVGRRTRSRTLSF